jgi:sporulation protein YlmC with PRC-barrel domain
VRILSQFRGREVVTESGRGLGRCHDVRAELGASTLRVTGLVLGGRGRLEHFGIGAQASASPTRVRDAHVVPWGDVVRFEEDRIVVRDRDSDEQRKGEAGPARN